MENTVFSVQDFVAMAVWIAGALGYVAVAVTQIRIVQKQVEHQSEIMDVHRGVIENTVGDLKNSMNSVEHIIGKQTERMAGVEMKTSQHDIRLSNLEEYRAS